MNNKGAIQDLFTGMAYFLAIAFIVFISAKVGGDVLSGIQNANVTDYSTPSGQVVNQSFTDGINLSSSGDGVFLIIFAGYILALIITSYLTNFSPAYFFLFLILVILGVIVSAPVSNAYQEFTETPEFASYVASFPVTDMVMTNLPFVIMLIGSILLLVTYGKVRN